MKTLPIKIREKIAVYDSDEKVVCHNSDYLLKFDFDAEWAEYKYKTAIVRYFKAPEGWLKHEIVFEGETCELPVIDKAAELYIGVFAGDIRTTTEAKIPCRLSALSMTGVPVDPPENIYNQILKMLEELQAGEVSPEDIKAAVDKYFADNPIDPADLGAVSADQGAENADRILGIGDDGKVIPVDKPQGDVKTVAGVKPDTSGNVPLTASDVGAATKADIPAVPVKSVNRKTGEVELTASDVGALPSSTKIPAKTSDLNNNSGFITKAVSDLANYYKKSETYTQAEVNARISAIPKFTISVVSALPTTGISATTIYLVGGGSGDDLYTEYIYTGGKWEILGSQRVDLTGYAKETWVSAQISAYLTAENIAAALGYTPANSADLAAKANLSGWEGNKYLGTDAAGNMVTRDAPAGEGGGSGTPGTSPHIGDNGNWWIGATDTGVKAQGPQGDPGSPGDPGTSPHIGDNGNWWIGATDTGVKAQGPAGNDYTLTDTDIANIASQAAAQIDVSGKLDKSGGTMTGKLVAQNNADYAVKQVRNIIQVEQGAAMPDGDDGDICIVYQLT